MLGLLRWLLPNDWLPPVLRGPFRSILVSNWLQMGRVAGLWLNAAGEFLPSLLSTPGTPKDTVRLCKVFLALGGGGGGALEDKDIGKWGAKGRGGGGPLSKSLGMDGGGTMGGGFLGSGLFGILCSGGMGGGVPLWTP